MTAPRRLRRWWMFAVVAALHVAGFGSLFVITARDGHVGTEFSSTAFSIGLGLTAYLLGLRHAFDVDHIAAIDNVTRRLSGDGTRPVSVGFFFAVGHSGMVVILALLVLGTTRAAGALLDDGSTARRLLGLAGMLASGGFLVLIAVVNSVAVVGLCRMLGAIRAGRSDGRELAAHLDDRGVLARILRPVLRRIRHPHQMVAVGALFGLGFDTASEVALLALAGTGAAAGLPWYAVLTLPALFAAGMTLMDTADGAFMAAAYDWALADPVRTVGYNLTVTGLSVTVAGVVGSAELVSVLHDLGWVNPVTEAVSDLGPQWLGFAVAGAFAVIWAVAALVWRRGRAKAPGLSV